MADIARILGRIQGATGLPSWRIMQAAQDAGLDLAKATPDDIYRAVTGKSMPGPAREYSPPTRPPVPETPAGPTLQQRLFANPDVRAAIEANAAGFDPAVLQRFRDGDPDAAMEMYQLLVASKGRLPARQMELPLGDAAPESRALIPFGVRGPGIAVGGPTGMGTARDVSGGLIPAPLRGLPGDVNPSFDMSLDVLLRRLSGESQQAPQVLRISGPQSPLGLPAPQPVSPGLYSRTGLPPENIYDTTADTGTGLAVIGRGGRGVPVGGPAGGPRGMIVRPSAAAGGGDFARGMGAGLAAGAGGFLVGRGAYDMLSDGEDATVANDDPAVVSGGTEDLAAETSPPPTVEPTADEPDSPAPAKVAGLPRRPGPDTGFIETNSAYSLKPAQQRTLDALLDAGIEPSRAEAIARGQRSLTQAEERAIIANGPARRQRDMDIMDQRRRARMGAY